MGFSIYSIHTTLTGCVRIEPQNVLKGAPMNKNIEKITFDELDNPQIVDLRGLNEFQNGHLKGALNLNPKNLVRYGQDLLEDGEAVVFVISEENRQEIPSIVEKANEAGIKNIEGFLVAEEIPADEQETVQMISSEKFITLEEDYQLLDVRHPNEITRPAPKKNLVNIPLEDLTQKLDNFDANQTIYTLCGSGNRSTSAASFLEKKGYKTAVIEGGMGALEKYTKEKEE